MYIFNKIYKSNYPVFKIQRTYIKRDTLSNILKAIVFFDNKIKPGKGEDKKQH